jgi:hypothetical protein
MGDSFLFGQSGGLTDYFGDGSDGALDSSGNITIAVTAHSGVAIRNYASLKLNAGHIMTTNNPCRGLVIYCQGDVEISGTISMDAKAGLGGGIPILVIPAKKSNGVKALDKFLKTSNDLEVLRGGAGGNGGAGSSSYPGAGGTGGTGRINAGGFGGGGGGGSDTTPHGTGGNGGSISYPDIGGGNGASVYARATNGLAVYGNNGINGGGGSGSCGSYSTSAKTSGSGGYCLGGGGGGGSSIFGSEQATAPSGSDGGYAGGFICIIAKGNITINSGGIVTANGGNGGGGGSGYGSSNIGYNGGGGGGGSGGGVIALYYKGAYTNSGTVRVNGGSGGSGGVGNYNGNSGSSGSVGTIFTQQL